MGCYRCRQLDHTVVSSDLFFLSKDMVLKAIFLGDV